MGQLGWFCLWISFRGGKKGRLNVNTSCPISFTSTLDLMKFEENWFTVVILQHKIFYPSTQAWECQSVSEGFLSRDMVNYQFGTMTSLTFQYINELHEPVIHGYLLLFLLFILRHQTLDIFRRSRWTHKGVKQAGIKQFVALCANQKRLCKMRICSDQLEKINPLHAPPQCSKVILAFVDDFVPDKVLQQCSLILDCDSFCVTPSWIVNNK